MRILDPTIDYERYEEEVERQMEKVYRYRELWGIMKVLIRCRHCLQMFWVRGHSDRPNEYCVADEADFSECCEHLQNNDGSDDDYDLLDCGVD